MGAAAAASAGIGLITGGAKFFEGRKMQKEAQKAIDNFKWQDLQNPYENLQVSTLGADLQREEAGRNTASIVSAIQSGGSRGIIGGLGRVQAQNNLVNRQIGADLDQQQKEIDYAAAGQEVRNQDIIERRQSEELAGYGQQLNVGMNTKYGGAADVANSLGAMAQLKNPFGGGGAQGGTPQVQTVNSLTPQGITPMGNIPLPNYLNS